MALDRTVLYSGPVDDILIGSDHIYYTLDGVTITYESEWLDIETDQIPGTTIKKRTKMRVLISFKVPELTIHWAKLALAQADANVSGTTLTINNDDPGEEPVDIYLPDVTGRMKELTFDRCRLLGVTEIGFNKGEQTGFKIEIEALLHLGSKQYGVIIFGS